MLEGLVAWVLRTYIGEYVENLNTDQLSVGIYQGQVELENLPLRKDALKGLDLPLEVKSGFIGKVQLSIPWNKLNSAPWVITLEKLYLIAGPVRSRKYNEEEETKNEVKRKEEQLKALEEKWKLQKNLAPQGGASWWSYTASSFASVAANIVENIQLNVKDVHLRYEDDVTISGCSFACGVTIKSLSAQSTDAGWIPKFVSRASVGAMHKLADLQNFAVYWDTNAPLIGQLIGAALEEAMRKEKYKHVQTGSETAHQFILEPVSAQAKMTRHTTSLPLRSNEKPRISLDIQLDKIPFELAEDQYRGMVAWSREFSRFDKARKYRRWKPDCPVRGNAATWWKFCTGVTLHFIKERNRRMSKQFLLKRAYDNVKYVKAYKEYLTQGTYMDSDLKSHIEECEVEMTFEELKILREIAMKTVAEAEAAARRVKGEAAAQPAEDTPLVAPSIDPPTPDTTQSPGENQGAFQRWFPGWGGWYGGQAPVEEKPLQNTASVDAIVMSDQEALLKDKEIEQEIISVVADSAENNTLLKRDTVFARINFCLQSGTFKLLSASPSSDSEERKKQPLLELECTAIKMQFESRPRTNGMRFGVSVGGLYLKDKVTKDSIMTELVKPQMKDKGLARQPLSGLLGMGAARINMPMSSPFGSAAVLTPNEALFEFVFEKKPQQSKSDYRVEVKSKPLDIVYNPMAIKRLSEFFSTRATRLDPTAPSAASARYEELKRNTQAEFQQALGRFLEGDEQIKAKRWDIVVDIAAPQFIVPESFTDSNSTLVVVDLGHLTFNNGHAGMTSPRQRNDTNEDDDDFVTPDSTPPNEPSPNEDAGLTPSASEQQNLSDMIRDMSLTDVHDKIYDKYTLDLSDLQVMVGTAKDNWKHAQTKGSSKLHVIDKFSISMKLERRLLYTTDPKWPKATLSGTLPSLVLHVSEQKVQALKTCGSVLSAYTPTDERARALPAPEPPKKQDPGLNKSVYNALMGKDSNAVQDDVTPFKQAERERLADSALLRVQFSINQVSLEIQSRERSIAELQVAEVSANLTTRPFDTSVSFAVQSLLVVDALQTFGTDFELLVASHKNLWLDSCSGSLRDSGASSPVSPRSPDYARSPAYPGSPAEPVKPLPPSKVSFSGIQSAVTSKLQGLVTSASGTGSSFMNSGVSPDSSFNSYHRASRPQSLPLGGYGGPHPASPGHDEEALIKLDIDIVNPESPSRHQQDTLHSAKLQFNNLDFVANQQTITELVGFVKRIMPESGNKSPKPPTQAGKTQKESLETIEKQSSGRQLWEVTAEFHRLNVLLMRVEENDLRQPHAKKVATATMLDAKIEAQLVGDLQLNGFLSGLQLLDLTPEGRRHQKIISVGQDPNMSNLHLSLLNMAKPDMYKTAMGESMFYEQSLDRALTFEFSKPGGYANTPIGTPTAEYSPDNSLICNPSEISLVLRMASLFYTHAPLFLKELSLCISDFTEYFGQVGDSIKTAATEVAMGLVQTKSDIVTNIQNLSKANEPSSVKKKQPPLSPVEEEISLNTSKVSQSEPPATGFRLDAQLQTPVIMLPRAPDSTQVLVGQLGKITLQNFAPDKSDASLSVSELDSRDKIHVNIRDISVYSMDTEENNKKVGEESFNDSVFDTSLKTANYGTAIVHDTEVSFTLQKVDFDVDSDSNTSRINASKGEFFSMDDVQSASHIEQSITGTKILIDGKVVTPLKVVLSKQVFEQLKDTLDNIAPPDDDPLPQTSFTLNADESDRDFLGLKGHESSSSSLLYRDRSMSDVQSMKPESPLVIVVNFELPTLSVNMTGDLGDGEQGLVELKLQDFKVDFERPDSFTKDFEISLQSLDMIDLLQGENSKHRHLMVSHSSDALNTSSSLYLSTSCPSSMADLPTLDMPPSLPNSLHKDNVWESMYDAHVQKGRSMTTGSKRGSFTHRASAARDYPHTPPPSPYRSQNASRCDLAVDLSEQEDRLVHIKVKLIDKKCPELKTKYNDTQRFIDVDFNRLETTINLQTWVVLLDFLGLGAKAHDPEQFSKQTKQRRPSGRQRWPSGPKIQEKEEVNNDVKLKIQSLSLVLNKPEYELANATVTNFSADVSTREHNLFIKGQLGRLSLQDSSPYGNLFRERFVTTGTQALNFDIVKYGLPDPDCERDCDVSFKLRMSAVWYVHTHRFIQEILAFALNFNQLQDVLGRGRAASAGKKVQEKAFRSARIILDIEAGAPIILIPHSSKTTDVLVIDMGKLSVHNSFKRDGVPGTVSYEEQKLREEKQEEERRERSDTTDTLVGDNQTSDPCSHILTSPLLSPTSPPINIPDVSLPPLPMPSSNLDPMMSSVYGSLDTAMDQRVQDLVTSTDTMRDAEGSRQSSMDEDVATQRSHALSSFFTTLGARGASTSPIASPSKDTLFPMRSMSEDTVSERKSSMKKRSKSGSSGGSSPRPASVSLSEGSLKRRYKSGDASPSAAYRLSKGDSIASVQSDPGEHICLLDVIMIDFTDIDLFSAQWKPKDDSTQQGAEGDLVFPSCVIRRESGKLLKEKTRLSVQAERNLEGEISHSVPDILIDAKLSSVQVSLDVEQYKLVKGLLAHNFAEPLEQFQTKLINFEDPKIQTVLSGEAWTSIRINIHMENAYLALLASHEYQDVPESTLAQVDFLSSRLTFDAFSDGTKDVDLVSLKICIHDTRYTDAPANVKPNVFDKILQPSTDSNCPDALQLELHYRSNKTQQRFTVLLNNMRVMGVFDWILAVKDYIIAPVDDPWKDKDIVSPPSTPQPSNRPNPLVVSTGVLTKRISREDSKEPPFEFCLNLTDSELVLVEDTADRDTNAVILKMTAILTFKPDSEEKPLQCNLQSLEVFSCSLSAEDETALSIIDPMSLNVELNSSMSAMNRASAIGGLLDATPEQKPPILEISFHALNVRVSYNDVKLFLAIVNSMPKQLTQAQQQARPKNQPEPRYDREKLKKLQDLGFAKVDCQQALDATKGNVADSALWLTQHAKLRRHSSGTPQESDWPISALELRGSRLCLCIIDDCLDADVPLLEFTVPSLHLQHKFDTHKQGKLDLRIQGDYYNRSLSGWEPFFEKWRCSLDWKQNIPGEENRTVVTVSSADVLNLNLTHVLMQQYLDTQRKWTEEYFRDQQEKMSKRRVPFVPFAIRNHTGCDLKFATVITTTSTTMHNVAGEEASSERQESEWKTVRPDGELPFLVDEREKNRHKSTHELKVHQLIVEVAGWQPVAPVSMDKIGVYFREAIPRSNSDTMMYTEMPPARVVFDVTIEGTARKVITVRSALMTDNQLDEPVEIRLENSISHSLTGTLLMQVQPKTRTPIPLSYVHSRIHCRPMNWSLSWCQKPILWTHVRKPGEVNNSIRACDTIAGEKDTYKFCVSVYRQHFPTVLSVTGTSRHNIVHDQPGHLITLVPPLSVENLLPIEMHFYLKETDIRGTVKPGKTAHVVAADLSQKIILGVNIENFLRCDELAIPPDTLDYHVNLRVYDTQDRLLELRVHILAGLGGSLKLTISTPYWLVNKSGLPLVFRQDGAEYPAAGQFEEHEVARSVTPLLFSYADKEQKERCIMRLGKKLKGDMHQPIYCHRFPLESGPGVRPVHVRNGDSLRPDWVYNIGIDVRKGRGRYRNTNIVTFSPRYQLDNRSTHKLVFAQSHVAVRGEKLRGSDYFSALQNCTVSFHWPRVDLDQLLSVRIVDIPDADWCGGFRIDQVDSFHINMRKKNGDCLFLRVDVVLQGATFFVVITDASFMPPPYRIDNFSEVAIQFFQTKCTDSSLRSEIGPRSSIPYAWDEPTLPPHITLAVKGGSNATYNMDVVSDGAKLYYENFIYVAFKSTFESFGQSGGLPDYSSEAEGGSHWQGAFSNKQEMVLEVVPPTNKVVLRRKESGNRNQLWRMTGDGQLEHEGTSAPQYPRNDSRKTSFVLDINDIALRPGINTGLELRKPDPRRHTTQTWQFTEDGRLCPASTTQMCVQVQDVFGLVEGVEAFLATSPPVMKPKDVPKQMQVVRQRQRPGSGLLSVKVITDGPTRVLQITDIRQQQYQDEDGGDDWIVVEERRRRPLLDNRPTDMPDNVKEIEICVNLENGVGLSLVSSAPEELVYALMTGIYVTYTSAHGGQITDISIKHLQVDNQLLGTVRPILLHLTPTKRDQELDHTPALQLNCHKMHNDKWDAHIFRHVTVALKPLTVLIEERLLWKLLQFFGIGDSQSDLTNLDESIFDSQRVLTAATSIQFKRYYFSTLKVNKVLLSLSMLTSSDLSRDLVAIKKSMNLPLVRFEDAKCELASFSRVHIFETSTLLMESLRLHYADGFKSQAAQILGSVDFLGNPLGFFNDLSEGVFGLVQDGNVGGLVKNVTHGTFNSAAKVTGSVSDALTLLAQDEHYHRRRKTMKLHAAQGSHIKAAAKGLGAGIWGGIWSIPKEMQKGIQTSGATGAVSGLLTGAVGLIAKPVAGALDFVSNTAGAVSYTSSVRKEPPRSRRPRCCMGPGGLLPVYSSNSAKAQEALFSINKNNFKETFIVLEDLRDTENRLMALLSSEKLYLLGKESAEIVLRRSYGYEEIFSCKCVPEGGKYYLELTIREQENTSGSSSTDINAQPMIRTDSEACAQRVVQQIYYAKNLFEEKRNTLLPDTL